MTTPYEAMVSELVAMRIPREKAEAAARKQLGVTPAPDPELLRDASILEKKEQTEIRNRFIVCGFKVYNLSQSRAAKQTPGLPDLWLTHRTLAIGMWWESKRQVGGRFSTEQLDFQAECKRCGVGYGAGDRYDAERYLISIGRAEFIGGAFEPIPSDGHPF